jgi:hypothetical protein
MRKLTGVWQANVDGDHLGVCGLVEEKRRTS